MYLTPHGTACFHLQTHGGPIVDISFPHAILSIRTNRSATRQPQWLKDYRAAARQAITSQIYAYRDRILPLAGQCPVSGEPVIRTNCHVDHMAPKTFDRLLFDFSAAMGVRPQDVRVDSIEGTIAVFEDEELGRSWAAYHQNNAELRLVSARGNLKLPKIVVPWET